MQLQIYSFVLVVILSIEIVVWLPPSTAFATTTTTTTTTTASQSQRAFSTTLFGKRMKFQPPPRVTEILDYISVQADGDDAWKTMDIVDTLQQGGIGVLPTEAGYGFVTPLASKDGLERLQLLFRPMDDAPQFCLLCSNTKSIDEHVYGIDKQTFKILKKNLPNGFYEFILQAKTTLPKGLFSTKKDAVMGVRIPQEPTLRYLQDELLDELPLLFVGMPRSGERDDFLLDEEDGDDDRTLQELQALHFNIDRDANWCNQVDFIVDAGPRPYDQYATTVYDLTRDPRLVREGLGDVELAI